LHGFKTTPKSFFSFWVKSAVALLRLNPAKSIFSVSSRVRKREVGDHVEAEVKTIRETTEGVRLQVSFGAETALIFDWQITGE
jgi:hypothetical protein